MDTIAYLDAVKTRHSIASDYKLAKKLDISLSLMSKYRTGRATLGDDKCLLVANLLEMSPSAVLIDVFAERTKCEKAAKFLRKTAKQLTTAAASLFLSLSMIYSTLLPSDVMASNADQFSNNVYYVK